MENSIKLAILHKYFNSRDIKSDINEHIPTLYEYAKECDSITECGVRSVVSTWAFVLGLIDNDYKSPKYLTSVDLFKSPKIQEVELFCETAGIFFDFQQGNDIEVDLKERDLLFIDTWHVYGHLKRELSKLAPTTKKYIIMHDTTVDAIDGETIRCGWDPVSQSKSSGYPVEEITKGLWPAIEEFLESNNDWSLHKRFTNNNGLTILKRNGEYTPPQSLYKQISAPPTSLTSSTRHSPTFHIYCSSARYFTEVYDTLKLSLQKCGINYKWHGDQQFDSFIKGDCYLFISAPHHQPPKNHYDSTIILWQFEQIESSMFHHSKKWMEISNTIWCPWPNLEKLYNKCIHPLKFPL